MIADQFRLIGRSAVGAFVLLASSAGMAAAQTGSLNGRVTAQGSNQPIPEVRITVVGTNLAAATTAEGRYTIRNVPAGTHVLRVLRIGYAEQTRSVPVAAGQSVTTDFSLQPVATQLEGVVTTATGQQRAVTVGNSIAQVNAAAVVATRAVANVGDLLTSRAPGVLVIPGTQTGAGTRIRIRGTSSLSLTNNPIYIVDGVRVEGTTGSSTISVGGTLPARVNDLNPEEIENIEVVRGPSAATLYGTDAANGVIVITTKHGSVGRPQLTYFTEQGAHVDRNDYPTAYRAWRTGTTSTTNSTTANTVQCFLTQSAAGVCMQDSVTSYNLYNDPDATPNGVGYRQAHGLQLGGGSQALRYFLHGEWEGENGVLTVPEFDQRYLAAHGRALLPEEQSPNHLGRVTARANFNMALSRQADIAFNTGYISQKLRLPTSDDSGINGVAGNTYGGPGFKYNVNAAGDTLFGYRAFTPRDVYQTNSTQAIQRVITSANGNWRPTTWLAARGNFGVDYINQTDTQLCRFAACPDLGGDSRLGFKVDNRTNFFTYTADGSATATRRLSDALELKTTAGVQFTRILSDRNGATGIRLSPGATTISGAGQLSADETTSESRTLGAFVEERVALNDRLFLTGAVRSDRNSAFGANFKTVFYPKLALSWVASDEPFFPKPSWLNQLRLRTAYGASGVQPGTIDAVQYFSAATTRTESGDSPGLVFSTLGNRDLKPERSSEFEAGVDGTFFSSRLTTELTYYHKSSRDALISRILPPSLGTGATARFENLGEVRNTGWEALVTAQLVQRAGFGWDVTFNGSTNNNKLVSLGGVPPLVGTTIQQREGYPLNGWWSRPLIGYEDKNKNGIIEYNKDVTLSEVIVGDTAAFLGYSSPRVEAALTNGFEFFQRRFRLGAMIDYKGGHKLYNNTERIRCASRNNCSGLVNPASSLFEQARTVAVRETPSRTVAGFIEPGDFIRFRELNLTFTAPGQWTARAFHGQSLTLTLAARNLGILWTKYKGVDPEAFGTTGNAPSEFQAFGPPTYYVARFSLGF
ncbi:MAG: SusC/RagA family TonB-linked outer membrane protein [Gemmatimonadaceae bacterium]